MLFTQMARGAGLGSVQGLLHQVRYGAQEAQVLTCSKQTLCLSCHRLDVRSTHRLAASKQNTTFLGAAVPS